MTFISSVAPFNIRIILNNVSKTSLILALINAPNFSRFFAFPYVRNYIKKRLYFLSVHIYYLNRVYQSHRMDVDAMCLHQMHYRHSIQSVI